MAGRTAEQWRQLVREWKRSGLSGPRFAERHGLAPRTLAWWQWRLQRDARSEKARPARTAVVVRDETESVREPVSLVRVLASGTAKALDAVPPDAPIELVFGDVLVRVRRGFDAETLGRVIDVLEGQDAGSC